jgi:hypothetical protein
MGMSLVASCRDCASSAPSCCQLCSYSQPGSCIIDIIIIISARSLSLALSLGYMTTCCTNSTYNHCVDRTQAFVWPVVGSLTIGRQLG